MKVLIHIFIFLLLTTLAACGGQTDNSRYNDSVASDTDSAVVRLGVLPVTDCLPLYVAEARKIFHRLGLRVRLVTFSSAMDADTAFERGHVDICVTDLVKACLWRARGDSVKVAATTDARIYLLAAPTVRMKNTRALKEKVVAVTRNSLLDYIADKVMADAHYKSEELNRPQINDLLLRAQMTVQNQYDGAFLPEPYASMCEMNGAHRVYCGDKREHTRLLAFVVNERMFRHRRAEVAHVVDAYNICADTINARQNGSARRLMALLPGTKALPDSLLRLPTFTHTSLPTDTLVDSVKVWLDTRQLLKSDFRASDLVARP